MVSSCSFFSSSHSWRTAGIVEISVEQVLVMKDVKCLFSLCPSFQGAIYDRVRLRDSALVAMASEVRRHTVVSRVEGQRSKVDLGGNV